MTPNEVIAYWGPAWGPVVGLLGMLWSARLARKPKLIPATKDEVEDIVQRWVKPEQIAQDVAEILKTDRQMMKRYTYRNITLDVDAKLTMW